MYPQGVCRIRKPAYAGNGCAIFPAFDTEEWAEKIRSRSRTIYSEVPKKLSGGRFHNELPDGGGRKGANCAAAPPGTKRR